MAVSFPSAVRGRWRPLFAPFSPSVQDASQNFMPHPMANAMTAVKPLAHALSPWLIFALLCGYAAAALAVGAWALTSRDT